jgi:hypothetical protein
MAMDRGLRAQLSPREEATLQQVSRYRTSEQKDFRLEDLRQLAALRLVEHQDGAWRVTAMGRARLAETRAS